MKAGSFAASRPTKIRATTIFLSSLVLASLVQIGDVRAASRPVVIELFTSQGCSSCPPADALLGELAQHNDLIALGYHVDYWDYLGWKDPLSAPGSTQRQAEYGRLLHVPNIYTPQMVIDGHWQVIGSDRSAVLDAIARSTPEIATEVSFAQDGKGVTISEGNGSGKVLLVRFVKHHETSITNGENTGTKARDINGVTTITELGQWQGKKLHFNFEQPSPDEGIAILVQAEDGYMIGANVAQ